MKKKNGTAKKATNQNHTRRCISVRFQIVLSVRNEKRARDYYTEIASLISRPQVLQGQFAWKKII